MSVQIDNLSAVDGLLLGGLWIDVDLGTLRRTSSSRGSGAGGIELYWISGGRMYVANAAEVHAVRSMVPEAGEEEALDLELEPERPAPIPPPLKKVVKEEPVVEEDPNSMMATLKRARAAQAASAAADDDDDDDDG